VFLGDGDKHFSSLQFAEKTISEYAFSHKYFEVTISECFDLSVLLRRTFSSLKINHRQFIMCAVLPQSSHCREYIQNINVVKNLHH